MIAPAPKLLTFDVYGTLVDWQSVNKGYVTGLLARKGLRFDAEELFRYWYEEARLAVTAGPFMLYRDVLRVSIQQALAHFGLPVASDDGADFGDAMEQAEPWPDSVEVLAKLAARYRLAAISNSQHDIICHALDKLGRPFTYVVTGEDARAYKPAARPFELTLQRASVSAADTLHVAQSQFADLPRSIPMGIRTAWINRYGEALRPGVPAPHYEYRDLRPLLDLVGCR
jgi:2-haloacid dehalogenase